MKARSETHPLPYRRHVIVRAVVLSQVCDVPGITVTALRAALEALSKTLAARKLGFDFVAWSGGDLWQTLEAMARTDLLELPVDAIPTSRRAWATLQLSPTKRSLRVIAHANEIARDEINELLPARSRPLASASYHARA